jgi:hypothetical protein
LAAAAVVVVEVEVLGVRVTPTKVGQQVPGVLVAGLQQQLTLLVALLGCIAALHEVGTACKALLETKVLLAPLGRKQAEHMRTVI